MKFTLISGSHRKNSESERVTLFVQKTIKEVLPKIDTYVFKLAENPLPLWDESIWSGDEDWNKLWSPIAKELNESDAIIVVTPEWSGMVPAGLKNFFLLCSRGEIKHKPGFIVSLSSGIGGTYPVAELRMSSYKNTGICYIPEHLILRNIGTLLKEEKPASDVDQYVRDRLKYDLKLLEQYAIGLKGVRSSGVVDLKTYPNGM